MLFAGGTCVTRQRRPRRTRLRSPVRTSSRLPPQTPQNAGSASDSARWDEVHAALHRHRVGEQLVQPLRRLGPCPDRGGGAPTGHDTAQAEWVGQRPTPRTKMATAFVPPGFEAYARILHPAEGAQPDERTVRWHDVATTERPPARPLRRVRIRRAPTLHESSCNQCTAPCPRRRTLSPPGVEPGLAARFLALYLAG